MKKLLLLVSCFFQILLLSAQQMPLTTFYQRNWQLVNPAVRNNTIFDQRTHPGNRPNTMLQFNHRSQWIGIAEAPQSTFFSVDHALENSTEIGGFAFYDRAGAFSTSALNLNYKYHIRLPGDKKFLSAGVNMSGNFYGINTKSLTANANNNTSDPILTDNTAIKTQTASDFSFGLFYRNSDTGTNVEDFYVGLSATQLISLYYKTNPNSKFEFRNKRTLVEPSIALIIGCITESKKYEGLFEPSLIVRYLPNQSFKTITGNKKFPLSIDMGMTYSPIPKIRFGGGYGTNQMLNGEFTYLGGDNSNLWQLGMNFSIPVFNRFVRLGPSIEFTAAYAWRY